MALLMLTILSCKSTKQSEPEIILPPKPVRRELAPVESVKDLALTIVYYESLVQEWELWGETVEDIVYGERTADSDTSRY